jgi:ACS family pantothenate transporter-like MFS transporter
MCCRRGYRFLFGGKSRRLSTVAFLSAALIATALSIRLLHAREVVKRRDNAASEHEERISSDDEAAGLGSDADLGRTKAP